MNFQSIAGIQYPPKEIVFEDDKSIEYLFSLKNNSFKLKIESVSKYTFLELNKDNILFAKDRDRLIYQSLDFGATWKKALALKGYKIKKFFSLSNSTYLIGVLDIDEKFNILVYDASFKLIKKNTVGDTFWHALSSIDERNGVIMYSEYPYNGSNFEIHINPKIFRSMDFGITWEIVYEEKYPSIKHWHTLQSDKFNKNHWIATSGDTPAQSKWLLSKDNGDSWKEITDKDYKLSENLNRSQSAHRTTVFETSEEFYFFATDDLMGSVNDYFHLNNNNERIASSKFYKSAKSEPLKIEKLCNLGIHIRSMIDIDTAYIFITEAQYVSNNSQVFLVLKNDLKTPYFLFNINAEKSHGGTNSLSAKAQNENLFFSLFGRKIFKNQDSQIIKWSYNFGNSKQIDYNYEDFFKFNENFWFLEKKIKVENILFFNNKLRISLDFIKIKKPFYLIHANNKINIIDFNNNLIIDKAISSFTLTLNVDKSNASELSLFILQFDNNKCLINRSYSLSLGLNKLNIKKYSNCQYIKLLLRVNGINDVLVQLSNLNIKSIYKEVNMTKNKTIPIECFLNRVFPSSFYKDDMTNIVNNKIFKPRKDCEDFKLTFPIDWEASTKKEDRNWRMQLQGWAMFHPIMNFFDESDEKEKIVDYFFDICNDWNTKYGNDADNVATSRMPESYAWYDMSVGFRALVIAFFIDRINIFSINTSKENTILLNKLAKKHINNLKLKEVFSLNNHGMFQIQGLMALIQLSGIEKYKDENNYALTKMEELVLSQYDNNGVHLEHSPHYHFYALTTFENLLVNDWYNEKPIIKEIVKKAQSIKKWLVDPYARPACIGDSIMTVQKNVDFKNNDFSEELEIVTDDKQFVYSNFNDSGYSIFRSKWEKSPKESTYLFFMGMYNRKTHKHRDCLSFEWFDNGGKILCDSGKYGYISDKYRNYFLSNRAHNTVEIEGFNILKIKPYGSAIKNTSYKNKIFIINSKLDYPAIKFDRTVYLKPNKWLIVVDDLDFQRARKATQWFHIEKSYKLVSSNDNFCTFKKNDKTLIIHNLNKNTNNSIFCGDNDNMQGFVSENDFVYNDAYALGFDFHGKNETLVTIFALNNESYFEALSYVKNEDLFQLDITEADKFINSSSLIKNIAHKSYLDGNIDFIEGKNTYSIFENEMRFDFYLDKKDSKEILIMLPGAIDRSKLIYNFQRYSWSDDLEYSLLSMLDPTVREDNEIAIGWFQGLENNYAGKNLAKLLKKLFLKNNIDESNVVFFGSSAGGFSSLKLANYFPKSKIIAINPQIYIYNYSENEFSKLLKYTFFNENKKSVINKHKDRLSVNIDFSKRIAPIYYYQNKSDLHHMKKHLEIYLDTLNNDDFQISEKNCDVNEVNKLNVVLYEDPESGHSPPSKEETIEIIDDIINNKNKDK